MYPSVLNLSKFLMLAILILGPTTFVQSGECCILSHCCLLLKTLDRSTYKYFSGNTSKCNTLFLLFLNLFFFHLKFIRKGLLVGWNLKLSKRIFIQCMYIKNLPQFDLSDHHHIVCLSMSKSMNLVFVMEILLHKFNH